MVVKKCCENCKSFRKVIICNDTDEAIAYSGYACFDELKEGTIILTIGLDSSRKLCEDYNTVWR